MRTFVLTIAAITCSLTGCERATRVTDQNAGAEEDTDPARGKTIGDAIASSGQDKHFAAAVKATGLGPTLSGPVPYTVLVPTDDAFEKMPAGALDTLMKPEARAQLTNVLTYHVLPGAILTADIRKAIANSGGKATLATMGGGALTATLDGDAVVISDKAGEKVRLLEQDIARSNGVVHRIDAVLMPS